MFHPKKQDQDTESIAPMANRSSKAQANLFSDLRK